MKKFSLLGVLFLLVATATMAFAQTGPGVSLQMKAVEGSKVTGTATITSSGSGVTVSVKLSGYQPNQGSAGHIHNGTCENQGGVLVALSPITADAQGNGTATTTLANTSYASIADGKHYVQYHEAANPPGKQVSCANIPASGAATGQGGAAPAGGTTTAPSGAPATGIGGLTASSEGLPVALLAALGLVVVSASTGLIVARRRK